MAALPPPLNLCAVLKESKRIVSYAHSRNFLALSFLFLFPLTFSFIINPTIQNLLPGPVPNSKIFLRISAFAPKALFVSFAFFVFVFIVSLLGSIAYSVYHGFSGRPVKLVSAIKSIFASFFPLLCTLIFSQIFVSLVFAIFGLLLFLVVRGTDLMGFQQEYSSLYFISVAVVVVIALFIVLLYLQVNWTLACVVVVVEGNCGFGSLTRSASLIKGMRRVAVSLLMFFGVFVTVLGFCNWVSALDLEGKTGGWKSWAFVMQIVVSCTSLMMLVPYNAAVNGEVAKEIAKEFAG